MILYPIYLPIDILSVLLFCQTEQLLCPLPSPKNTKVLENNTPVKTQLASIKIWPSNRKMYSAVRLGVVVFCFPFQFLMLQFDEHIFLVQPPTSRVYKPIIWIPYFKWDDHPSRRRKKGKANDLQKLAMWNLSQRQVLPKMSARRIGLDGKGGGTKNSRPHWKLSNEIHGNSTMNLRCISFWKMVIVVFLAVRFWNVANGCQFLRVWIKS